MHMRQLMAMLSDERFGESESDYFKRQMQEQAVAMLASQVSLGDLREACRLRYLQTEVLSLLRKLDTEQSPEAIRRGVALLLKEVFFI